MKTPSQRSSKRPNHAPKAARAAAFAQRPLTMLFLILRAALQGLGLWKSVLSLPNFAVAGGLIEPPSRVIKLARKYFVQ